jgi:hypothetical protein
MVRAGKGAGFVDQFTEYGVVAIGCSGFGHLIRCTTKEVVEANPVADRNELSMRLG